VTGFPFFTTLAEAFENFPEIQAVVLSTPPSCRYQLAKEVILAKRHVFLEKPPGSTVAGVRILQQLALDQGVTLFTSWHSRCTAGTKLARQWLNDRDIKHVRITWKEDVRHWHPYQDWLFEQGGLGVYDTGINALSIATYILPKPFALVEAVHHVPANRQAPITATLTFKGKFAPIRQGLQTLYRRHQADIGQRSRSPGPGSVLRGTLRPLYRIDTNLSTGCGYIAPGTCCRCIHARRSSHVRGF